VAIRQRRTTYAEISGRKISGFHQHRTLLPVTARISGNQIYEDNQMPIVESTLDPCKAIYDYTLPAGEPWLYPIKEGQPFASWIWKAIRLSTRCFTAPQTHEERYSATDYMRLQGNLTSASVLN